MSLIFKPADGPLHSTGSFPNVLTFDLHGNGAVDIAMTVKKPGPDPVPAETATSLELENVAEGAMAPYTSLINDVLEGNRALTYLELADELSAYAKDMGFTHI